MRKVRLRISSTNAKLETLRAGQFRHRDHGFGSTRERFQNWAAVIAERFGYKVEYKSVGDVAPVVGPPTQIGVFQFA